MSTTPTPTFRRGDVVRYTDGQGKVTVDRITRVEIIPGYTDPSTSRRWYTLKDLGLTVADGLEAIEEGLFGEGGPESAAINARTDRALASLEAQR